ncbi:hypothetical protein ASD81_13790 [Nocardioides sp. Root614]|nr:hypothetical protein ASD81_13790 [Nocardioides sp. Root614]KRA89260.1 hypothetical protein ASD84_14055 [Nocardioides sp. Root682]
MGGIAPASALLALTTRRRVRTAVSNGLIRKAGRNRYVLPAADQARRAAVLCHGHITHLSAAMHWDWEVRVPPTRPQIAVPHGRPLPKVAAADVRRLPRSARTRGWATDPLTTVLQCARDLPFPDALAVADSALRHGDLTYDDLQRVRATSPRVRRVLLYADGRAANPFESTLRALAIECGLDVVPQYEIHARGLVVHPDLVDPIAGVAIEAESWEWHGKEKRAFESDCERYTALVVTGWRVLRFTWAEVMLNPDHVRACLRELYAELAAPFACRGLSQPDG